MHYLKKLLFLWLFIAAFKTNAQQITPTLVGTPPFCAGTSITINLTEDLLNPITFNGGNNFLVKLIDGSLNATTIATIPGTALPSSVPATIPANTPSGNYQIRVEATATTPASPTYNTTAAFGIDGQPVASTSGSATICVNGSYTLGVTEATAANGTILWTHNGAGNITNGTTTTPTYTPAPADAGNAVTLTMTVTSNNTCSPQSVNATYTVNVNALPTATAGGSASACVNGSYTLGASEATATNGTILWTHNGNGAITNATTNTPTYTPVLADAGNAVTLTMTVTSNNSCSPASVNATYTVNVDPLPTATAGGNATICVNGSYTLGGAEASATNGTILWTENGAGSITAGANTLTPTYTPAAGDAGNAVILTMTVTSNNSCNPQSVNATYTINVAPLPLANAGPNQSVCVSGATSITGASASNGTISWTHNGLGVLSNATSLSPNYAPVAADAGNTITLTMTVTSNNVCAPATAVSGKTITVGPIIGNPSFPLPLGANSVRCQGANTLTYTATATNTVASDFTYSLDPVTAAFTGNSINPTTGDVTYAAGWSGTSTITATVAGCGGPKMAAHTVTTTPSVANFNFIAGNPPTRCKGGPATVNFPANANNATSIVYSLDPVSLLNGNSINPATGQVTFANTWSGPSVVTASVSGCNALPNIHDTILTVDAPVFASNNVLAHCQGLNFSDTILATNNNLTGLNPISYSINNTGASGIFINPNTGVLTIPNSSNFSGIITVTASATGCPSLTANHSLTVHAKPRIVVSGITPGNVTPNGIQACSGSIFSFIVNSGFTDSLKWQTTAPGILSGFISSSAAFQQVSTQPFQNASIQLSNSSNIDSGIVSYIITPRASNGCVGNDTTINLIVHPNPQVTTLTPADICSADSTNIALTSTTAGVSNFNWSTSTANNVLHQVLTNQSSSTIRIPISNNTDNSAVGSAGTLAFTVAATSNKGCTGATATITQTVHPKPNVTTSAIAPPLCSGDLTNINLTASTTGVDSFTWQTATPVNILNPGLFNQKSNIISVQLTNVSNQSDTGKVGTVTFIVTPKSDKGCTGPSFNIAQTVNPRPKIISIQSPPICSGFFTNVQFQSSTDALGINNYTWNRINLTNVNPIPNPTLTVPIRDTLFNSTDNSTGSITYEVTASTNYGGGLVCVANASQNITQVVHPIPTVTTVTPPAICNDDTTKDMVLVSSTNPLGIGTFSWTSSVTTGSISGNTNSGAANPTFLSVNRINNQLHNNSNAAFGTVSYTITAQSSEGCISAPKVVTQRVNPTPKLVVTEKTICSRDRIDFFPATTTPGASIFSWRVENSRNFTNNGQPLKLDLTPGNTTGELVDRVISLPAKNFRDSLVYIYELRSADNCFNRDNDTFSGNRVKIIINPTPDSFNIVSPAKPNICSRSMHELFRIDRNLNPLERLTWTTTSGANNVFQPTDSNANRALILNPVNATITLTSVFTTARQCSFRNTASFDTSSTPGRGNPLVILKGYKNNDTVLICLANNIVDTFGYRWGRTRKANLQEERLQNVKGSQEFLFRKVNDRSVVDTNIFFYWVETMFIGEECERRIYLQGSEPNAKKSPITSSTDQAVTMKVYPNPAYEQLTLELVNKADGNYEADIFDVAGKLIRTVPVAGDKAVIGISYLQTGYYIISCRKDGLRIATQKFIKH